MRIFDFFKKGNTKPTRKLMGKRNFSSAKFDNQFFGWRGTDLSADKELQNNTLDTLTLSRSILKDKVENHKLNTLAEYFEVTPPTHSAKDDVMTTFEIYKKLSSIQ